VKVDIAAQIAAEVEPLTPGKRGRCLFHSQAPQFQDRRIFEALGGIVDVAGCRNLPLEAPPFPSVAALCTCKAPEASANAFGLGFVEAGAVDGQFLSNLFFFESQMGWRGICIEASPLNYVALMRNRPLCRNVNAVLSSATGSAIDFLTFQRDGRWEAASSCVLGSPGDPACKNAGTARAYADATGAKLATHSMATVSLGHLLALQANVTSRGLGWVSADVSGTEEAALAGGDWGIHGTPARYISYASGSVASATVSNLAKALAIAGYVSAGSMGSDAFFTAGPALSSAMRSGRTGSSSKAGGGGIAADPDVAAAFAALAGRSGNEEVNVTAQILSITGPEGLLRPGHRGQCLFHSQEPHYQDRAIFTRLGGVIDAAACKSRPLSAPPLPSTAMLCPCTAPPASSNAFGLAFLEIGALDGAYRVRVRALRVLCLPLLCRHMLQPGETALAILSSTEEVAHCSLQASSCPTSCSLSRRWGGGACAWRGPPSTSSPSCATGPCAQP